ncbi:cupin domain-containing protein [Ruficoccus sp. ZRK36]|uniref:cupin domain-containing protein n=1 Tax=Ruficoccus sp. ZRK36 TaxID=2866311 RepID=UPI001C736FF8|nr:cupin domain-containing protein [Ruficoccus sp. ZRK36]QYY36190.1 cupin domain-containing protein [Ruficoccus sp. ZRK36]
MNAEDIIRTLELEPLPDEGGYFRRIHTHPETLPGSDRPLSTCIYYLITPETCSLMHRIDALETYHFHGGDPVEMLQLHPDGSGETVRLGSSPTNGERPFAAVPPHSWQGSRLAEAPRQGYALFSVTVTPGFVWEGFEMGQRSALIQQWPAFAEDINTLTLN